MWLRTVVVLVMGGLLAPGVAAAADVPFERAAYNTVATSQQGNVTTMRVTERPAGLSYTATLDPAKTYRIRVVGRTSQRGVVMRIRTDDRLRYLRAPNGLYSARVHGARALEILLFRHYSTDDEEYRIFELSAAACVDQCPSDNDLREEILDDRPALAAALAAGDRVGAATEIMHWAAVRTPVAAGAPMLQTQTDGLTAAELWYDQLSTHEIGVLCAGASAFLIKLLDLFGISAFELDFGDPDVYTHAAVVVDAGEESTPEWHLLDPTFDTTLRAAGSRAPLPLAAALEAWRAGRSDLIEVESGSLIGRPVVYDPESDGSPWDLLCDDVVTSGWSGCGLRQLANDFDAVFEAAGHGRGYDAMLSLFARGTLFSTEHFATPPAFGRMHAILGDALRAGDSAVHIADLPLAPRNLTRPSLMAEPATPAAGLQLTARDDVWQPHPGGWDVDPAAVSGPSSALVEWLRCTATCTAVPGAGGRNYAVSAPDLGARIVARVTVANRWGATTVQSSPSEPVVLGDLPPKRAAVAPSSVTAATWQAPPSTDTASRDARRSSADRSTRAVEARPTAPIAAPRARIEGTRRAGRVLRCATTAVPARAAISWWRESGRRAGSGRHYRVRAGDRGHHLRCRATSGATVTRSTAVRIRSR